MLVLLRTQCHPYSTGICRDGRGAHEHRTILVKTINKLSTNRVIIQDIDYLETMLDGAMSAPEVVYAIARDQEGRILVGKSKGILQKGSQGIRDPELLLFPDDALTTTFFSQQHRTPYTQPLISVWHTVPQKIGKDRATNKWNVQQRS